MRFRTVARHIEGVSWCVIRRDCGCVVRDGRGYSSKSWGGKAEPPWDIMFFGSNEYSLSSLKALHEEQQKVSGLVRRLEVVTLGMKKPLPAVRRYCCTWDLPVYSWPLKEVPQGYHIGIVVSFGHLIPARIINAFPMGILNVHASLLPRWRGAAPVIHAVLQGDRQTGISLMRIQPHRFDVGSVVSQVTVPVAWDTKSGPLTNQLSLLGAQELVSALPNLPEKLSSAVPQLDVGITNAPKVSANSSLVEWSQHTCHSIQSMFLALDDYFPLWTHWQGLPVKLRDMVLRPPEGSTEHKVDEMGECGGNQGDTECHRKSSASVEKSVCDVNELPGTVVYERKTKVVSVRCVDGWVSFRQIVVKGRKPMKAQDFNNGFISKVPKEMSRFAGVTVAQSLSAHSHIDSISLSN